MSKIEKESNKFFKELLEMLHEESSTMKRGDINRFLYLFTTLLPEVAYFSH